MDQLLDYLQTQGIDGWQALANHGWAVLIVPMIQKLKPVKDLNGFPVPGTPSWKKFVFGNSVVLWATALALAAGVTWLTNVFWTFADSGKWVLDFGGAQIVLAFTLASAIAGFREGQKTAIKVSGNTTTGVLVAMVCGLALFNPEPAQAETRGFVGYRHDDGNNITVGVATKLVGPIWNLTYGDIGPYGSAFSDMALIVRPHPRIGIGILAGSGMDFGAGGLPGEGATYLDYVLGAGGFLANYEITDDFGLVAVYKYKWALDGEVLYPDGAAISAAVHFKLHGLGF